MNRRQFLLNSGRFSAGTIATTLAGPVIGSSLLSCSTFDQVFSIEKADYDGEVVIVGGGPAGLMAALTCKKMKLPYRIFEGSSHLGGRARSATYLSGKSPDSPIYNLDLGVDTVDERHRKVFELCRELNLELIEKNISSRWENAFLWDTEKFLPLQKYRGEFEKVVGSLAETQIRTMGSRKLEDWDADRFELPEVVALDQLSFKQYILDKKIKLSAVAENFLNGWCLATWGRDMSAVSVLAVMIHIDPENRGPTQYRLRGGFGGLTHTMYQRSAGVIVDHLVKTNHMLMSVEESDGIYYCNFSVQDPVKGGTRTQKIKCRRLIIALPISQVSTVNWQGDLKAQMEPWTSGLFGTLNPQTKSFHGLNGSPQGKLLQNRWAVSQKQIYRVEHHEEEGLAAIISASESFSPEGKGFPTNIGYTPTSAVTLDWSRQKGYSGARWGQAPGNITSYQKWKRSFKTAGKIAFAGEFDSTTYPGTLEGAFVSGQIAVTKVI